DETYDAVFDFLERLLPFQSRPASEQSWYDVSTDNYRFIIYELFLYWIAILIHRKRYTSAARFIEGTYNYTEYLGGGTYLADGIGAFYEPIPSLDEHRNSRLHLRRLSVAADMVKERANWPRVGFRDLIQADCLLFIRPFFPEPGAAADWYPRLIP